MGWRTTYILTTESLIILNEILVPQIYTYSSDNNLIPEGLWIKGIFKDEI